MNRRLHNVLIWMMIYYDMGASTLATEHRLRRDIIGIVSMFLTLWFWFLVFGTYLAYERTGDLYVYWKDEHKEQRHRDCISRAYLSRLLDWA